MTGQPQRPSLLQWLSAEQLTHVLIGLERRYYPSGSLLIREGDSLHEMFVIEAGTAAIVITDRQLIQHYIEHVGPGDTLGEMSLFTGQPASASVRAESELDVLVLDEPTFHRIAMAEPQIYRNLSAILAERLRRSNWRSVHRETSRISILRDLGAPPLLSYALACSMAWHARRAVLLLVVDNSPPDVLVDVAARHHPMETTAEHVRPSATGREPRASIQILSAAGTLNSAGMAETLSDLRQRYDHIVVLLRTDIVPPHLADRTVTLMQDSGYLPLKADDPPGHTIRGWTPSPTQQRPDKTGVLRVPPPNPLDEMEMTKGLLPPTTPCGSALGWAARDLTRLKVGLALGAGAVKGYAHIGVLRVLERIGLSPDYLVGTSIGAAVAALVALKNRPDAVANVLDSLGASAFRLGMPSGGLLSNANLRTGMQRLVGNTRIEDLDLPLGVVAADITAHQEVVFRTGLLWQAVLASMAIPGIYPPQRMGELLLVDGGVLNPVPSDVAVTMGANVVIAVRLTSQPSLSVVEAEARPASGSTPSMLQVLSRSLDIMQSKISAATASSATILIEADVQAAGDVGLHQFSQGRRYIDIGEAVTEGALPRIRSAVPWLQQ